MEKKNMLEAMIQRAEQAAQDKVKYISIKSTVLGEVNVKVPPLKKMLEYLDESSNAETAFEDMTVNAQMVYDCTDLLKENYNQLSEAYDEKDPAMLTMKIFEAAEATGEINDIATKLIEKAGMTRKVVKN